MSETQTISGSHLLRVRYAETDQMGIVYHTNYLIWFHEARDALLRKAGVDTAEIERDGYRFPVTDVSCQYHAPARYGDEVLVRVHLDIEPVARMIFRYEAINARTRRLLASGKTVSVTTDPDGRLLLRMPDSLNRCLMKYLSSSRLLAAGASTDRLQQGGGG